MPNRITDGEAQVGSLRILGGDAIGKILMATVALEPGSVAAATREATAVAVPGAAVGDVVIANPPAALEAELIFAGAYVSDANEVTVLIYNSDGSNPVVGAELNWDLLVIGEA